MTIKAEHHPDCYPSKEAEALEFFRAALKEIPPRDEAEALAGVIAPHIDFRVSPKAHALAFRPLLDRPPAETYLILGVGHRSRLEWNLDPRDYETPLGRAVAARELLNDIVPASKARRFFLPAAHEGEHSIEFPLLWLQAIHRFQGAPPARFLPVLCGSMQSYVEGEAAWDDLEDFHLLTGGLKRLIAAHLPGRELRVIVSIDGCHLGPRFQHPFEVTPALLQATKAWENNLWSCAARGDAHAFLDWFRDEGNDRYFDGVGALALLLAAGEGRFRPERTHYEQWFTPQDTSAVTFSSGRISLAAT